MRLNLFTYDSSGNLWKLDLPSDFRAAINFEFFNLRDITRKNRVYSNTINLPSTANNDRFFLDAYDHKSNLWYNQKKSIKAFITSDTGEKIVEGKLFIVSAKKINNIFTYSVNFIGNTSDIFQALEGKSIRDCFNNTFDTFLFDNSTYINDFNTPNNIALVPIDNGDIYFKWINGGGLDGLGLNQYSLYPAIKMNYLLEKIIEAGGYTLDSSSTVYDFANYALFQHLYIVGDNYNWRGDAANLPLFIGWNCSNNVSTINAGASSNYIQFYLYDTSNFLLACETVDNQNIHNTSTGAFTLDGTYLFKHNYNIEIDINFQTFNNFSVGQNLTNYFKLQIDIADNASPLPNTLNTHNEILSANVVSVTNLGGIIPQYIINCKVIANISFNHINVFNSYNDVLRWSFALFSNNSNILYFKGNNTLTIKNNSSLSVSNLSSAKYGSSTAIPISLIFREDTLAVDVLRDILRAFNLLMIYDGNKITLKTFNQFFDTSAYPDITELVSSAEYELVLNSEYQAKALNIEWAERKDYFSQTHKEWTSNNVSYGDRQYNTGSEFSDSDVKIKLNKLGTIAMTDTNHQGGVEGFVRNALYTFDKGSVKPLVDYGLRLVVFNGMFQKDTYIDYFSGNGITVSGKCAMYSHFYNGVDTSTWATLYDAIQNASPHISLNLNFAYPQVNWYSNGFTVWTTNNDIYRNFFHYFNMLYNSEQSRILRIKMFIPSTLKDILTHRKIVFYDGAYWIVNKINNFRGFGEIYDVELIKYFFVELPGLVTSIDNSNNANTPPPTARLINNNIDNTISITASDLSVERISRSDGGLINMTNRIINYDYSEGDVSYQYENTIIDSVTIIINNATNGQITVTINGTVVDVITITTSYIMKKFNVNYESNSTSSNINISKSEITTSGNITLILQTTKIN